MQSNNTYECISISNVINQLNLKKTNQIGSNIYLVCPFCQCSNEKNGYMKANIINNLFICNNCEESGTSIDLYAKMKYITTKEAYKQLLKETPILDNIPYVFNNPIKDENYRDLVYKNFLNLQKLTDEHKRILENLTFTDEYIINNNFKSIETKEKEKKKICEQLQEMGLKLDGISGFFQDKDFKWTYKSHKGIFIPAIMNNKIQGLRIFLDKEYGKDIKNIWFSSNNQYNGTKANNWPTILKDENMSWRDMYNSCNNTILISTEIILAHKIFNNTNKIVIGIPNNIDKNILWDIVNRMGAKEVFIYFDIYTLSHICLTTFKNTIFFLQDNGIKTHFRTATLNDDCFLKEIESKEKVA